MAAAWIYNHRTMRGGVASIGAVLVATVSLVGPNPGCVQDWSRGDLARESVMEESADATGSAVNGSPGWIVSEAARLPALFSPPAIRLPHSRARADRPRAGVCPLPYHPPRIPAFARLP